MSYIRDNEAHFTKTFNRFFVFLYTFNAYYSNILHVFTSCKRCNKFLQISQISLHIRGKKQTLYFPPFVIILHRYFWYYKYNLGMHVTLDSNAYGITTKYDNRITVCSRCFFAITLLSTQYVFEISRFTYIQILYLYRIRYRWRCFAQSSVNIRNVTQFNEPGVKFTYKIDCRGSRFC